jgi:hypothetical protein
MSIGEGLLWLSAAAGIVWLMWKGGGYRLVGILALFVTGWAAERRFTQRKRVVELMERKSADTFAAKTAPRIHERRKRLNEWRVAREQIEKLEVEYEQAKQARTGRIADLWNATFGRGPGAEREGGDAPTSPDGDEGSGDDDEGPRHIRRPWTSRRVRRGR